MFYYRDLPELLSEAKKQYFLDIGQFKLSPVSQISSYIILKYISELKEKDFDSNISPFFYCFPDKKMASVWISTILLTNFFYEDYIESEGNIGFEPEVGKKYMLLGSVTKFIGKKIINYREKYIFLFKGNDKITCEKSVNSILQNVDQNRVLNKVDHYKNSKKESKGKRSTISKIFEPNEGVNINDEILKSKILIIAGRGSIKSINKLFEDKKINNESIRDIYYSTNDNIIVRSDLKGYVQAFDNDYESKLSDFVKFVKILIADNETDNNLSNGLGKILSSIEEKNAITSEIEDHFYELCEEYKEVELKLIGLKKSFYPGIGLQLPNNLRAVIINDINQIEEYSNTIDGFLKRKIPVIVVANRLVDKVSDFDFYNRLFDPQNGKWKDAHRINWNKSKLKGFKNDEVENSGFVDGELWEICCNYAKQSIEICISESPEKYNFDENIRFFQQNITRLEGFENLKLAFFKFLYPVLFAYKNSGSIEEEHLIHSIVARFKKIWKENKQFLQKEDFKTKMSETIEQLKSGTFINSKQYINQEENIFCNTVAIPDFGNLNIPVTSETNLPEVKTKIICFTGFPFHEISGKYLQDACLKYFIPKIKVFCWPNEGRLTYDYLKRRIKSGYFIDKIPDKIGFPYELLLNSIENIESEVAEILQKSIGIQEVTQEIEQVESDLIKLDDFQYGQYKRNENSTSIFDYQVKCNVLRFDDGCFMFLPSQSTVLSEYENESGKMAVRKLKFNELSSGLRVFKLNEQVEYAELLKHNENIAQARKDLTIWRNILENIAKEFDSVEELKKYLTSIAKKENLNNANPDVNNLRRWLNDEDMLAPNKDNLSVILLAGKRINFITKEPAELIHLILNAYSFINRSHISLGHQVKSAIAEQLNKARQESDRFTVKIENVEIEIVSKLIIELQQNNIEIDYHNTRKFLC